MKLSRYNWLVSHRDYQFAYNGFTGALAKLDRVNAETIGIFFDTGAMSLLNGKNSILFEQLKHGGFIVESDFDEVSHLAALYETSKHSLPTDLMTIALTQECNLNCIYCYQGKSSKGRISKKVSRRIIEYVDTRLLDGYSTNITLYGGEPLLCIDDCIHICRQCSDLHRKHGKQFRAGIVTNGTLLSEAIANSLSLVGVSYAQVTIDGNRKLHDSQRPYINGEGSFDVIVRNITEAAKFIQIRVRVNIDSNKTAVSEEDIARLRGISQNISVYLAPVSNDHMGDFSAHQNNSDHIVDKFGMRYKNQALGAQVGGCTATRSNGLIVNYNGELFNCWSDIGNSSEAFGNILSDDSIWSKKQLSEQVLWNTANPYRNEPCLSCKMLPACGGGCPDKYIKREEVQCRFTEQTYIDYLKFNIDQLSRTN